MFTQMKDHLAKQLAEIKANGLYKVERTIITPQSSAIRIAERSGKVLNFCANNYLGPVSYTHLTLPTKRIV